MRRILYHLAFAVPVLVPGLAAAQAAGPVFNGGGLTGGVDAAGTIEGPVKTTFRQALTKIIGYVLDFVALAAVVAIIVAGLYLILGMGSDESRTKAKNIMLYTVIGLAIIILARVIVGFFTTELGSIFN